MPHPLHQRKEAMETLYANGESGNFRLGSTPDDLVLFASHTVRRVSRPVTCLIAGHLTIPLLTCRGYQLLAA